MSSLADSKDRLEAIRRPDQRDRIGTKTAIIQFDQYVSGNNKSAGDANLQADRRVRNVDILIVEDGQVRVSGSGRHGGADDVAAFTHVGVSARNELGLAKQALAVDIEGRGQPLHDRRVCPDNIYKPIWQGAFSICSRRADYVACEN